MSLIRTPNPFIFEYASSMSYNKAADILEALYNGVTYSTTVWDNSPEMRRKAMIKTPFNREKALVKLNQLYTIGSVEFDDFDNQCLNVKFNTQNLNISGYVINHGSEQTFDILARFIQEQLEAPGAPQKPKAPEGRFAKVDIKPLFF